MKALVLATACLLLCECLATPVMHMHRLNGGKKYRQASKSIIKIVKEEPSYGTKAGLDLCPTCIQFTDQAINNLLNIILQIGVVGSCGQLCGALENKTGSAALGVVCNLLCDYVGVQEFVKLIQAADLDSIYFCELIKVCEIFDGGDATITNLAVSPNSGPQGTFVIEVTYTSKNGTGTGEMVLEIETVDGIPIGGGFILEKQAAGTYGSKIKVKATPDPNCDPMQGPCEEWLPGLYNVNLELCNGECGSKHPHSQIYDNKSTNFTITQQRKNGIH